MSEVTVVYINTITPPPVVLSSYLILPFLVAKHSAFTMVASAHVYTVDDRVILNLLALDTHCLLQC